MNMNKSTKVIEIEAKHALGKSGMRELDYAFNPYLGCFHGCKYCYAIDMTPAEASQNWGSTIMVRTNIINLLEREARTYKKGIVGVSTITDPYQYIEMKYRIMPDAIDILCRNGFYVTVQTKSPLILKDMIVLQKYRKNLDVGITVTSMKSSISRIIEPHAPAPEKRLNALKRLSINGINTWLYLGPLIQDINDDLDDIEKIIEFCEANDIRIIYDSFQDFKGTLPYMLGTGYRRTDPDWWERLNSHIIRICKNHGVSCIMERDEWKYEISRKYGTLF